MVSFVVPIWLKYRGFKHGKSEGVTCGLRVEFTLPVVGGGGGGGINSINGDTNRAQTITGGTGISVYFDIFRHYDHYKINNLSFLAPWL